MKIHLISSDTERNQKQWMDTVCGRDGYLLKLTLFTEQVTCRRCKATQEYKERSQIGNLITDIITRVEVIDENGRSYVNWSDNNKVDISIQDNGRTLKVFITKEEK